ncbi:MAG: hypothetical protein WKF34_14185 [Pyrinomonadaceae bacterium]
MVSHEQAGKLGHLHVLVSSAQSRDTWGEAAFVVILRAGNWKRAVDIEVASPQSEYLIHKIYQDANGGFGEKRPEILRCVIFLNPPRREHAGKILAGEFQVRITTSTEIKDIINRAVVSHIRLAGTQAPLPATPVPPAWRSLVSPTLNYPLRHQRSIERLQARVPAFRHPAPAAFYRTLAGNGACVPAPTTVK